MGHNKKSDSQKITTLNQRIPFISANAAISSTMGHIHIFHKWKRESILYEGEDMVKGDGRKEKSIGWRRKGERIWVEGEQQWRTGERKRDEGEDNPCPLHLYGKSEMV